MLVFRVEAQDKHGIRVFRPTEFCSSPRVRFIWFTQPVERETGSSRGREKA